MHELEERLRAALEDDGLVRVIFSHKRKKSLDCKKVTVRPVSLSGRRMLQAEFTFAQKVTHQNLTAAEALPLVMDLINRQFKQINIFTAAEDVQILAAKPDKPHITCAPPTRGVPTLTHDRTKKYQIPDGVPCDFLIRLGVMDQTGKVVPRHYAKFRQINRYLEIVEDVFPALPADRQLRIIDFGCGKAYLTFALYYYLHICQGRDVEIIGLDLKKDVIAFCNKVATDLHYDTLRFQLGDIADFTSDHADMVVTLHACDTATDYALIHAVSWNAPVILSVPCCQHELFSQIKNDIHQPMLKHGILKDRLTEYLTDGLRALKLEAAGYDVALIEFTSLEHTARNIMIKAVRTPGNDPDRDAARAAKAQQQYEALRDFYQVRPTIEKL